MLVNLRPLFRDLPFKVARCSDKHCAVAILQIFYIMVLGTSAAENVSVEANLD